MPARREDISTAEIVKRYTEDLESSDTIGAALGISPNTVLHRLREAGVERRRSGPAAKYDEAEICRLYRAGVEVAVIHEKTGCHNYATFYDILKRNGVPVRLQRYKRDCPETQREIKRLRFEEELTQEVIGKRLGMSRNYVGQVLRKAVSVERKTWQPSVTVTRQMSIQEMRDKELTIDEIAEITGKSRVDIFQELGGV